MTLNPEASLLNILEYPKKKTWPNNLFTIYINDVPYNILDPNMQPYMFADDPNVCLIVQWSMIWETFNLISQTKSKAGVQKIYCV